jgi:hypothetical protein
LNISPDNLQIGPGDTAGITVSAIRRDGFNDEIKLEAKDLPKGFTASDAVVPAGQNQTFMTLTSPADVPKDINAPTVVGTATVGGKTVTRKAMPAEELLQAFFIKHTVSTQELFMSVTDTPRFTLSVKLPGDQKVLEVPAGGETTVQVAVKRNPEPEPKPGAKTPAQSPPKPPPKKGPNEGRINLGVFNPFPPVPGKPQPQPIFTVADASILPDKDQAEVKIKVDAKAKPDTVHSLVLRGEGNFGGDKPVKIAPAIPVRILGSGPAKPEAKK